MFSVCFHVVFSFFGILLIFREKLKDGTDSPHMFLLLKQSLVS